MTIIFLVGLFCNLKNLFTSLQTIHYGHLDIHKDKFVGPILTFAWSQEGLGEHFDGLFAIEGQIRLDFEEMRNQHLKGHEIEFTVIDQKYLGFTTTF